MIKVARLWALNGEIILDYPQEPNLTSGHLTADSPLCPAAAAAAGEAREVGSTGELCFLAGGGNHMTGTQAASGI